MGCYVNPPDMDKGQWLMINGETTGAWPCDITETHLPVCLVDNGLFTAAAVGYDQREVDTFSRTSDRRPKMWFKVAIDKLRQVSPVDSYMRH